MAFSFSFIKRPLSWIYVVAPLVVLAVFQGYGFLSIVLTSSVLILSSLIFNFSKERQKQAEKWVRDEIVMPDHGSSTHLHGFSSKPLEPENESITQEKGADQEEEEAGFRGQISDGYLARSSPVILSESDCLGRSSTTTSEDSEVDWPFQDKMFRSPDFSDGSISDEDSLIEIDLPGGHYVCHKEDDAKFNLQKKLPDFSPGSFLTQQGLMELLAELNEMNEEDNLIEIDISMGSIKCPRFEIEA